MSWLASLLGFGETAEPDADDEPGEGTAAPASAAAPPLLPHREPAPALDGVDAFNEYVSALLLAAATGRPLEGVELWAELRDRIGSTADATAAAQREMLASLRGKLVAAAAATLAVREEGDGPTVDDALATLRQLLPLCGDDATADALAPATAAALALLCSAFTAVAEDVVARMDAVRTLTDAAAATAPERRGGSVPTSNAYLRAHKHALSAAALAALEPPPPPPAVTPAEVADAGGGHGSDTAGSGAGGGAMSGFGAMVGFAFGLGGRSARPPPAGSAVGPLTESRGPGRPAPAAVPPTSTLASIQARRAAFDERPQPHVEALSRLLDACVELLGLVVRHLPVSPAAAPAQRAVASAFAAAIDQLCGDYVGRIVGAYAADTMLHVTIDVARGVLVHAHVYDREVASAAGRDGSSRFAADALRDILADTVTVAPRAGGALSALASSQSGGASPTAVVAAFDVDLDSAVTIVDEAADQVAFMAQLLQRYLALSSRVGGGGSPAAAAAAPPTAGASASRSASGSAILTLSALVQQLQDHYVLLEHGYLLTSVRHAVFAPAGWAGVLVHEDDAVQTHAWCDHAFFLLSKAISRALATEAEFVVAATCNYVANCLTDAITPALRECVARCARSRLDVGAYASWLAQRFDDRSARGISFVARETSEPSAAAAASSFVFAREGGVRISDADELEAEFAARLSGALGSFAASAARPDGAAGAHVSDKYGASGPPQPASSAAAPTAAAAAAAARFTQPEVASLDAVIGANTLATAADFAGKLYRRVHADVEAVFPAATAAAGPTRPSASRGASGPARDAPLARCAAVLQPVLAMLWDSIASCDDWADEGVQRLAALCLSPGLAVLRGRAELVRYDQPLPSGDGAAAGGADAQPSAFLPLVRGPVLHGGSVFATLRLLWRPPVADAFVRAVATGVLGALEAIIMPPAAAASVAPLRTVSEMGALGLAGDLRELQGMLAQHVSSGSLKREFARWSQMVELVSLDALADVYELRFAVPLLTAEVAAALLRARFGASAVTAVPWERLRAARVIA